MGLYIMTKKVNLILCNDGKLVENFSQTGDMIYDLWALSSCYVVNRLWDPKMKAETRQDTIQGSRTG